MIARWLLTRSKLISESSNIGAPGTQLISHYVSGSPWDFDGLRAWLARWVRKERTGNLLSDQEICRLWVSLFLSRKNLLCYVLGEATIAPLYVLPYYVVDLLYGSSKIFIRKTYTANILTCWHLLLVEFDVTYVTQKLLKGQAIVDHFVENPISLWQIYFWMNLS